MPRKPWKATTALFLSDCYIQALAPVSGFLCFTHTCIHTYCKDMADWKDSVTVEDESERELCPCQQGCMSGEVMKERLIFIN